MIDKLREQLKELEAAGHLDREIVPEERQGEMDMVVGAAITLMRFFNFVIPPTVDAMMVMQFNEKSGALRFLNDDGLVCTLLVDMGDQFLSELDITPVTVDGAR